MAVTVSPKYQVVIPEDVRRQAGIRPGMKLEVVYFKGSIRLIPVPSLEELEGALRGMDIDVEREKQDREI
jgi:AbrB family looped-hinge helix DNA binding protein